MKARPIASALAILSFATFAAASTPACSGTTKGSGFDNPDNPGGGDQDAASPSPTNHTDGGTVPILGGGSDAGDNLLDAGCATATAQASKQPVYMLFVVDGSGSMQQDGKWTAVVAALDSIFDQFQTNADHDFGAGLIVFSDKLDPSCGGFLGDCMGPYPTNVDVPISFVDSTQHGKLRNRIDPSSWNGGTPTGAALQGGYGELKGFTPSAGLNPNGKKVLVLLTDGVPTDCSTPECVGYASAALKLTAPQGPITTFVIGTGVFPSMDTQNFDPSFLGQLAQAGGAAPMACNPTENANLANLCYFEVDPSKAQGQQLAQQFIDAINKIRGQIASCTFSLEATDAGTIDPNKVNVVLTGSNGQPQDVLKDPANGWTYDDPNNPKSITLHGTSCQEMMTDPKAMISIVLGCATKIPK